MLLVDKQYLKISFKSVKSYESYDKKCSEKCPEWDGFSVTFYGTYSEPITNNVYNNHILQSV